MKTLDKIFYDKMRKWFEEFKQQQKKLEKINKDKLDNLTGIML